MTNIVIDVKQMIRHNPINSYHAVRVYINGCWVANTSRPVCGEDFKNTALKVLQAVGVALKFDCLWRFGESIGRENIVIICNNDIINQKDLRFEKSVSVE